VVEAAEAVGVQPAQRGGSGGGGAGFGGCSGCGCGVWRLQRLWVRGLAAAAAVGSRCSKAR